MTFTATLSESTNDSKLGSATIDDIRALLKDYNSVLDLPAAMFYDKLYEAYPDSKFILVKTIQTFFH